MPEQRARRAPFYFDVAAGSPAHPCRFCPVTIYYVPTASGKRMPVRCDVDGGKAPTDSEAGRGLSHFSDCPGAGAARRPR